MDDKKELHVTERPILHDGERPLTSEEREAVEDAEMKLEAGATTDGATIQDSHWKPGFTNRFPYLGFGSLVVVLICAVGAVLNLSLSNGVSQSRWPAAIAPNVIISILNSVANLAFGIAISNGIAIAWWRKTLQGATIEQLNRSWQFSSSLKDVVLGAKYFNFIALAALTAKLTIIDGTLLQKAFSTEIRQDNPVQYNLTGYANTTIPLTGRVSGRGAQPGLLAKNFNDDLKIWAQGGGLLPNSYAGCDGLCFLHVPGAGFEFDCSEPQETKINNGVETQEALIAYQNNTACLLANATNNPTCTALEAKLVAPLFQVGFTAQYDNGGYAGQTNYSYITMDLMYTTANDEGQDGQGSCPGSRYTQTCQLRPAIVNYPVKIEQYKDSHTLTSMSLGVDNRTSDNSTFRDYNATMKQQNYFQILRYNDIHETHITIADDTRTRLGGVAQGLNTYLGGNASMYFGGAAGFYLDQSSNAPTYLTNDLGTQEGKVSSSQYCGFKFVNPMAPQSFKDNAAADPAHHYDVPSVIGKINQIMFALALDISNEDDDKDMSAGSLSRPATVYKDTIHYVTNKAYMWGAFASILFCILCVLPVYWGYWQLGREVTLGPFEIAAAFRAPNLYHPTNPPVKELIKEVGDREVKFGHIVAGGDAGKIAIAEPEYVARIHPSAKVSSFRMSMRSNGRANTS